MKRNVFIISVVIILFDQIIKLCVEKYLLIEIYLLPKFFSLYKVHNNGAAFSIFSGKIIFLILMNVLIFIFLFKYMKNFKINLKNKLAFGFVFGGLIGNLIDRVYLGYVIDYLKFDFKLFVFPIFNLADIMLCLGMFLLIIAVIRKEDEV